MADEPSDTSFTVSRETETRLGLFVDLLNRWNATSSLIGDAGRNSLYERHILDSLRLVPLLEGAHDIADLGSGAGFPGLVLAIVTGRPIVLIEANQRKIAFLREAVRITSAPATLAAGRIESLNHSFDLITARAVAPLKDLLPLVAPRLRPGGRGVFPKGRGYAAELAAARQSWEFDVNQHQDRTSMDDTWRDSPILEVSNIRRRERR